MVFVSVTLALGFLLAPVLERHAKESGFSSCLSGSHYCSEHYLLVGEILHRASCGELPHPRFKEFTPNLKMTD